MPVALQYCGCVTICCSSVTARRRVVPLMSASDLPLARPCTTARRRRSVVASAARAVAIGLTVTAATLVGTLAVADDTASAVSGPLATNAMAPVVTTSARQALDSYDQWIATDDASDYRSFVWFRTQAAQYAAIELGYPQDEMVEAWASTPGRPPARRPRRDDPDRCPVPHEHQPGERRLRLLRSHDVRVGSRRRPADPSVERTDPRGVAARSCQRARPATSCSTRAT